MVRKAFYHPFSESQENYLFANAQFLFGDSFAHSGIELIFEIGTLLLANFNTLSKPSRHRSILADSWWVILAILEAR